MIYTKISRQEQTELINKYKISGDQDAQLAIIQSCLIHLNNFIERHIPYRSEAQKQDFMSEGVCGLLEALEKFDTSRGVTFLTYAHWYAGERIRKASKKDYSPVRIPIGAINKIIQLKNLSVDFHGIYCRNPTTEELSALSGFPVKKVRLLLDQMQKPVEIDVKTDKTRFTLREEKSPLSDILEAEKIPELERAIGELDEKEQFIIRRRFGLGSEFLTLSEIGAQLGVTAEWIRICEKKILRKLKKGLEK